MTDEALTVSQHVLVTIMLHIPFKCYRIFQLSVKMGGVKALLSLQLAFELLC